MGVAVAFYLGFKNSKSYERMWEARKIYGAIVNQDQTKAVSGGPQPDMTTSSAQLGSQHELDELRGTS